MRIVFLSCLVLAVLSTRAFSAEILGVSVVRGANEAGDKFDRINAMMLLEPGEEVFVEYFAFRSYLATEPASWVPLQFTTPEGTLTYQLSSPGRMKNEGGEKQSMQLYVDHPLKGYAGPERGWNTLVYSIRVSHLGEAPERAPSFYSSAFPLSEDEPTKLAEFTRTGIVSMPPFPLISEQKKPDLVATTVEAPAGVGPGAEKWVVDLPAVDTNWDQLARLTPEQQAANAQRVSGYFQPGLDLRRPLVQELAPRTENNNAYEKIYFFTNRPVHGGYKKEDPWIRAFDLQAGRKNGQRAEKPYMGWTDVYVPVGHRKIGQLGTGKTLAEKLTGDSFKVSTRRHFYDNKSPDDMFRELWDQPVMIFLHGFNVDLEEAIERAAQMKVDMKWEHAMVVLDWPSYGRMLSYGLDRDIAENDEANKRSIGLFLAMLTDNRWVKSPKPRGNRFLLCHSMGNEVFEETIKQMEFDRTLTAKMFNHIFFAAPDVYIGDFEKMILRLRRANAAEGMTLYYSRKDVAVNISRFVNFIDLDSLLHPSRIVEFAKGRAGVTPHDYEGVDIINADLINSDLADAFSGFYHGYFASSDKIEKDIETVIKYGMPAKFRTGTLMNQQQKFGKSMHYVVAP